LLTCKSGREGGRERERERERERGTPAGVFRSPGGREGILMKGREDILFKHMFSSKEGRG